MVAIIFKNGRDWFKPNWLFRQLSEDVQKTFPDDQELIFVMEQAEALGGLHVELLTPSQSERAVASIKRVAEATLAGEIQGLSREGSDGERYRLLYLVALEELLEVIYSQDQS